MFPSSFEVKKPVSSYFDPEKHCLSYLKREKSGSLLFGHLKNVVQNCQEHGKRL